MKIFFAIFILIFNILSLLNAKNDSIQFVNDYAKLLEPSDVIFLEDKLKKYDEKSGIKIYFGNLKTIGRKNITDYVFQLHQELKLSPKEKSKAVIILVSKKEMQGIIYEGETLKPYFSEILKQKIIQSLLVRGFKEDDYFTAYDLAFVRLEQLFSEKITPQELELQLDKEEKPAPGLFFYFQLLMFVLLFIIVLVLFAKSVFRKK